MGDVTLSFVQPPEVYFLFSYAFRDCKNRLVGVDQLERLRRALQRADGDQGNDPTVRFDDRTVYYSFSDSFCTPREMPLVIDISPGNIPIGGEATVLNGELAGVDLIPKLLQIRLSQHGCATIRVLFEWPLGKAATFGSDFLDFLLCTLRQRARSYADATWAELEPLWYGAMRSKLCQQRPIDSYLVLFSAGIRVTCGRGEFLLGELKRGGRKDSETDPGVTEKMVVGLAISSYLWPHYSDDFVRTFLQTDVSTTDYEFQFIAWRNALLYSEPQPLAPPAEYGDYLKDMLLALELLFIIRSSLQLLDSEIDTRIGHSILERGASSLPLRTYATYRGLLQYFDRWLVSITGWRRINRYAVISHFHDFLASALEAMRIHVWLNAIDDKINLLRDAVRVQTARVSAMNMLLLTVVLVVLTLLMILRM